MHVIVQCSKLKNHKLMKLDKILLSMHACSSPFGPIYLYSLDISVEWRIQCRKLYIVRYLRVIDDAYKPGTHTI